MPKENPKVSLRAALQARIPITFIRQGVRRTVSFVGINRTLFDEDIIVETQFHLSCSQTYDELRPPQEIPIKKDKLAGLRTEIKKDHINWDRLADEFSEVLMEEYGAAGCYVENYESLIIRRE